MLKGKLVINFLRRRTRYIGPCSGLALVRDFQNTNGFRDMSFSLKQR